MAIAFSFKMELPVYFYKNMQTIVNLYVYIIEYSDKL